MLQPGEIVKIPPEKARKRVVIEGVRPEIDGGRFPAKRSVGEYVRVEADIVADGHRGYHGTVAFPSGTGP